MSQRKASDLHKRWARLRPPLRPPSQAVSAMIDLIGQCEGRRLLLGVTPELAVAAAPLVAIDWSRPMIAGVWPGNTATRTVVEADWFAMPFAQASFGAVLGDGVLNMLSWPDGYIALAEALRRVSVPGARIVLRTFVMPQAPQTLDRLAESVMARRGGGFHAFKWRLAMATRLGGPPNLFNRAIWEAFSAQFRDREALSDATGWPIETIAEIDDYAVSSLSKSFPSRAELLDTLPGARLVETHGYELADCCPLLVIEAQ